MKMKTQQPKTCGILKSRAKRKVHSNTGIPQETRKKSNKQPNSTPKALERKKWRTPELVAGKKS